MQYPTRNRSSRQKSYNNLVDVEHDEKNVATTKCSKEDTPLSSSRILFNRRQGITSTNMISRLKSRISFNRRRQQQRITPKKQPVINSKKRGEGVSNSNSNMNMRVNSDNNSPILSSSQTCCSTSSGSSSSSKSTSELELQSNKLVEGSSSQQKQPPPPPQQKEEEKGQGKEQSKQKHKTEAFHTFFLAIVPSIKEMWKDNSRRKNSGRI